MLPGLPCWMDSVFVCLAFGPRPKPALYSTIYALCHLTKKMCIYNNSVTTPDLFWSYQWY